MPRSRVRKSEKGQFTSDAMEAALKDVLAGKSIRASAKERGLNYNTVNRYFKKLKGSPEIPQAFSLTSNYAHNLVFPPVLENGLAAYIEERSELGHGLSIRQIKRLPYDLAVVNNLKVPETWNKHKLAGIEWFGLMKRHARLSVRTPEACSVARASAFNKPNVLNHFNKLKIVLDRNPKFQSGERLYNADEIGTTSVGGVIKIVALKGVKQVHQVKSHERGESVASLFFVCGNGTFIQPVMLFPRKNVNNGMLKDCYPNTLALASGKKGYMNHEMIPSIQHFIKYTAGSKENPSLLIVDNFGSKTPGNRVASSTDMCLSVELL